MSRLDRSLVLFLALALPTGLGCKLSTSGLPAFSPGRSSSSPAPSAAASAPTSTAEVAPIESECDFDSRTDEQKADGVPPQPCVEPRAGTPEYELFSHWENRKKFIRPVVAAAPGRATVGRFRAPWCTEPYDRLASSFEQMVRAAASGDQPAVGTEVDGARWLCIDADDPRFQDLSGAYVQAWVNETGGTVAEVTAYLALYAEDDSYPRMVAETCAKHAVADTASERARSIAQLENAALGCVFDGSSFSTPLFRGVTVDATHALWHVDRDAAPPSQLAELGRLAGCMTLAGPEDLSALADYAMCRPEVGLLDGRQLDAELVAGGYNAQARATAALSMSYVKARLASFEAALQSAIGDDADLRAVLIDAGQRGWSQWIEHAQASRAAVDGARAYEERYTGTRPSAAKGCRASAAAAFYGYVATRGASTYDALAAAATDPVGAILAEQMRSCFEAEGDELTASLFESLILDGAPRRGPRFAAIVAMRDALAAILSDRTRFAIDGAMLSEPLDGPVPVGFGRQGGFATDSGSVVSKVETRGDRVYVTFKIEKWTEDEVSCKETNHVLMISNDGGLIYARDCRKTGRKVERSSQSDALHVARELAGGIAAGRFVKYRTGVERDGEFWAGVPAEVWSDKAQTTLVAVAGMLAK